MKLREFDLPGHCAPRANHPAEILWLTPGLIAFGIMLCHLIEWALR